MNRQHYVIVVALAFASPALADFEPTTFAELAGDSEMVAAGKIVRIEAGLFWLEVEDAIAGPCANGETFRILPYDMLRKAIVDFRKEFRLTPSGWRSRANVGSDRIASTATPISAPRFRPRRPLTTAFRERSPLHRFLMGLVEAERKKIESRSDE